MSKRVGLAARLRNEFENMKAGDVVDLDQVIKRVKGWPRSSYSSALNGLTEEGLLHKAGRGAWVVVGPELPAVNGNGSAPNVQLHASNVVNGGLVVLLVIDGRLYMQQIEGWPE